MPKISILIPTRDRAAYLGSSISSCLTGQIDDMEVLVLDNASSSETSDVVRDVKDARVRYLRSETRLSMRDNFERGLDEASGDIIAYIGDDDGLVPGATAKSLDLFARYRVGAISARRAHYAWPDLLSSRKNTLLVPRSSRHETLSASEELYNLLSHGDYYRIPCVYHGFVSRALIERSKLRTGRFFNSSQVDIYSAIALSQLAGDYASIDDPLFVNGGSQRSNGASHFQGGSKVEAEKWKAEDDIGFLPGFCAFATVPILIIESALRHVGGTVPSHLGNMFRLADVKRTLADEARERLRLGRDVDEMRPLMDDVGLVREEINASSKRRLTFSRARRLVRSFLDMAPMDGEAHGIKDVKAAGEQVQRRRSYGWRFRDFPEEVKVSLRLAQRK